MNSNLRIFQSTVHLELHIFENEGESLVRRTPLASDSPCKRLLVARHSLQETPCGKRVTPRRARVTPRERQDDRHKAAHSTVGEEHKKYKKKSPLVPRYILQKYHEI